MPDDSRSDGPSDPRSGKPDLDDALREMAEEDRRGLGGHPDPVTLLDYHEGRLPEAEADRVQEHLALCPECAGAVLDFAAFPDLEPPSEEHRLSPADVESQRRALERRLESERRPVWQRHQVLLPLAAGLFLAVVGLGAWAGVLRERLDRLEGPRGDAFVVGALRPEGAGLRGGDPREIPDWAGRVHAYLILPPAAELEGRRAYEVDVVTTAGRRVLSGLRVERSPEGHFVLDLPRTLLPAGQYRFELYGLEDGARRELASYGLVVGEGAE